MTRARCCARADGARAVRGTRSESSYCWEDCWNDWWGSAPLCPSLATPLCLNLLLVFLVVRLPQRLRLFRSTTMQTWSRIRWFESVKKRHFFFFCERPCCACNSSFKFCPLSYSLVWEHKEHYSLCSQAIKNVPIYIFMEEMRSQHRRLVQNSSFCSLLLIYSCLYIII